MLDRCRDLLPAIPAHATGLAVIEPAPAAGLALAVGAWRGPNLLAKRDAGRWVLEPLGDAHSSALGLAAGDVDGCGGEELYIVNGELDGAFKPSADRLLKRGRQGWSDLFERGEDAARNLLPARSALAWDRRGSGRYGFLVASSGAPLRLFELDAEGAPLDAAAETGLDEPVGGQALLLGPLDAGRPALLAANRIGPGLLFGQRGEGEVEEVGVARGLAAALEGSLAVGLVDAGGLGRLDLLALRAARPHVLLGADARGSFVKITPPLLAAPSRAAALVIADLDNDGFEEIVILNDGEPSRLIAWREGGWRPIDPGDALAPTASAFAALVADLDGDGRLELVVSQGPAALGLRLYKVPGPDHAWLRVLPRTRFGAPARGAVIRLRAGGREQVRVVASGGGAFSHGEPVAHFGLGGCERVEEVDVLWPDGASLRIERPGLRRLIDLEHP